MSMTPPSPRRTSVPASTHPARTASAEGAAPAAPPVGHLPYDPYARSCPSRPFLKTLGGLWTVLAVGALSSAPEPLRFKDLEERIDGVSAKMLTQTLRGLERDGLVEREQFPEIPPRVTYRLTEAGRSLASALGAVEEWAVAHMDEVAASRERYDSAH